MFFLWCIFCVCISILDLATLTMAWFWCFKHKLYFVYFLESLPDCWVWKMKGPSTHWLPFFSQCVTYVFLLKMLHLLLPEALRQLFYYLFIDDSSIVYAVPSGCVVILISSFHRCHPRSRNPPDFVSLHRRFQLLTHFDSRFWVGLLGSWCLAKILVDREFLPNIFIQGFYKFQLHPRWLQWQTST